MTDIDIFAAIGQLDDKYVIEADPLRRPAVRRFTDIKMSVVAACLIAVLALSCCYAVNDYDYLVWRNDIGDDHIVQHPLLCRVCPDMAILKADLWRSKHYAVTIQNFLLNLLLQVKHTKRRLTEILVSIFLSCSINLCSRAVR